MKVKLFKNVTAEFAAYIPSQRNLTAAAQLQEFESLHLVDRHIHPWQPEISHGLKPCFTSMTPWKVLHKFGSTRWALTSYKWSNPYKWVTGVITPISGIVTIFTTGRGPSESCRIIQILRISILYWGSLGGLQSCSWFFHVSMDCSWALSSIIFHPGRAALEKAEQAIIKQSKYRKKIQKPICKFRLCECSLVLNI